MTLRDFVDGAGREHAFDDLPDLGLRLGRRLAGRQQQAEAAVARLVVGAGQHEIAESGEAHERVAVGAERHAEPHHLGRGRA